jgi:hypothetical protein
VFKANGFKRTKTTLGWVRPRGELYKFAKSTTICEEVSILYLKEFESLDQPYGEGDDIAVTLHLICRGEIGISRSPDSVLRPAALLLP